MMNDLVLSEDGHAIQADDYHDDEDWYESRPGSEIGTHGNTRRLRRGGNYPLYMIIVGAVLIFGGIGAAFISGGEDAAVVIEATPAPTPVAVATPAPTSFEDGVYEFLLQYVDKKVLLDDASHGFKAYSWLMKNADIRTFGNSRIRQRFALASVYFSTNQGLTSWENDENWITDENECSWYGVMCKNGDIVALNFTSNGLEGMFPDEISMLRKHLLALELGDNNVINANQELGWMGQLTKLKLLDVEDTGFTANGIPSFIGKLTDLRILDIANANFLGDLDGEVFKNLNELVYVDIGGILFNSTLPSQLASLPKLKALYAYNNGLTGELESFLPEFKAIYELWLDDNAFSGNIPAAFGSHPELASLSLSDNALTGQLPTELGKLTMMEQLWLYGNWLDGSIPSEIGLMTQLKIFGIEDNNFAAASMPSEICALDLIALGADCEDVQCSDNCCTCCVAPCPVASLQMFDANDNNRRHLLGL